MTTDQVGEGDAVIVCVVCKKSASEAESQDWYPSASGHGLRCPECHAAIRRAVDGDQRAILERLRCPGCGAAWGSGCSCASNKLAIGRGERAKAEREEGREP